jgi:putative CocE/NonD family hydrolase
MPVLKKLRAPKSMRELFVLGTAATFALSACATAETVDRTNVSKEVSNNLMRTEAVPVDGGVSLATIVYLPEGQGPFPAIVLRSAYDIPTPPPGGLVPEEDDDEAESDPVRVRAAWSSIIDRGYAVVLQNSRGRHKSGGIDPLFGTEREDGAALAKWITQQPWSNGLIGVAGDSADGFTGHLMMAANAPGVRAGFFQVTCGRLLTDGVVRRTGGILMETLVPWFTKEAFGAGSEARAALSASGVELDKLKRPAEESVSALFSSSASRRAQAFASTAPTKIEPLRTFRPGWQDFITEAKYPELSRYFDTSPDISAPVMQVGLWQDTFLDCTINQHQQLSARSDQHRMMVFDGTHYDVDEPGNWPVNPMIDWFDHHLKGSPLPAYLAEPVSFTVENATIAKKLRSSAAWPPPEAQKKELFLSTSGALVSTAPESELSLARVDTDPKRLVATDGGRNLILPAGTKMKAPDTTRSSIFTSTPMAQDTTIAGPVELDLVLVPAQPDSDIVAKVVSIAPDGSQRLLVENLFRGRYMNGRENPRALTPGEPITASFLVGHLAHRIPAGHRISLVLQGSNTPRWDVSSFADADPALQIASGAARTEIKSTSQQPARLRYNTLPN